MKPQPRFHNALYLVGASLLAGLMLVAMILAMPATASEQTISAGTTVWLDGPAGAVGVDDEITVTIRISDVVDFYGIEVGLHFTPTDMVVVDADGETPGVQIAVADCPIPDFLLTNAADNMAGTIEYVVTQLNPTPPFSGSCSVAHIRFKTLQETSTGVRFASLILADSEGSQIPAETVDLTLDIGSGYYYSYVPLVIGKAN
ncbi:MAG: cohesin domain-containing protein [Chloroflexota bacterium]|jgi:hypothetical protein